MDYVLHRSSSGGLWNIHIDSILKENIQLVFSSSLLFRCKTKYLPQQSRVAIETTEIGVVWSSAPSELLQMWQSLRFGGALKEQPPTRTFSWMTENLKESTDRKDRIASQQLRSHTRWAFFLSGVYNRSCVRDDRCWAEQQKELQLPKDCVTTWNKPHPSSAGVS